MNILENNLTQILNEKTTKIIPENIKKGVTIFNVTGALESSAGSTVEGIKQFSTVEEMQADTTAKEGDLAVVYRSEIQNATVDSKFQVATFPDTVVLDTAITDSIEVRYRAVDSSKMFDCMGSLDSSRFMMDCYTDNGSIRIQYTSSDGITYTRTDTTGNPVDFGTEIYYETAEHWNDVIGKFIQISGSTFEGLFEYQLSNERAIKGYKISSLTLDTNTDLINVGESIIGTGRIKEAWLKARDYFINQLNVTLDNGSVCTALLKDTNTIVFITEKTNGRLDLYYNGSSFSICSVNNSDYFNEIEINLSTLELAYKQIQPSVRGQVYNKENMPIFDQYKNYYILGYNESKTMIGKYFSYYTTTKGVSTYKKPNLLLETSILQYIPAQTQLTTVADEVYLTDFYGKNGVETGILSENISNSFADTNAEIYSKIQNQYENMEPRVLTDSNKTINKNIYFIPVKKDGTVLLDTSNVTNMNSMFGDCTSLITIPLLDTSNVTDMRYMFQDCTSLTAIPLLDTSKVTNMRYMFYGCTNLTTIPLLDTGKVTYMDNMFQNCTSLSDESLNNILAMCKNATSYTGTKTLKYIGLTSEQANKCKTLSNYSAFTAAGWTTGY